MRVGRRKARATCRVKNAIATTARHWRRPAGRTESAYVDWIRPYIVFHPKRHPSELGAPEITAFLTWLATDRRVSASTQNQALSAVLFLYRTVLRIEVAPSITCRALAFRFWPAKT